MRKIVYLPSMEEEKIFPNKWQSSINWTHQKGSGKIKMLRNLLNHTYTLEMTWMGKGSL